MKKISPCARWIPTLLVACVFWFDGAVAIGRTVVRFTTNLGAIDVELFDDTMPVTVGNFMNYVRSGRYASSIFHRSTTYNPADIQIVQGGGFFVIGANLQQVNPDPAIILESSGPNLRGTIVMARTNELNSATTQWFFNVSNNSALDGNYAVFGQIIGASGLSTLDALAGVPAYNVSNILGPVFSEIPLLEPSLVVESLLMVQSVAVVDPVLQISSFEKSGAGVRIDWAATPTGRAVDVQRTSDLKTGSWTTIAEKVSDSHCIDPNPPAGRAFYRVMVP